MTATCGGWAQSLFRPRHLPKNWVTFVVGAFKVPYLVALYYQLQHKLASVAKLARAVATVAVAA